MDPYRVLGLPAGATPADVKRAYRALAKQFHPDSAGPSALPRFLAIQEAYEALTGDRAPGGAARAAARASSRPWTADSDRARATRDTYRARRTRPTGGRPGGAGRAAGGARGADRPPGARPSGRERPPDRATPGSTSYDGADAEPFTPEWQGGSWYGASSGTYWTINPKEYADPRKHGPEYQARSRRPLDTAAGSWTAPPADAAPDPAVATPPPAPPPRARHAEGASQPSMIERLLRGEIRTPVARVVLTLLGWPALAIGLGALVGETTGCLRFAAGCPDIVGPVTLGLQVAIGAVLLAVPRLAGIAAAGAIGMLLAALPATAALVPNEGPIGSTGNGLFAAVALVVGWAAGALLAGVRRSEAEATR